MFENPPYGFARKTPKLIKAFIAVILFLNLLVTLQSTYLPQASFYSIFALSTANFSHSFLWSLLTYSFLLPSTTLSFGFFLQLAFYLYTFWIFSLSLVERIGQSKFALFYFISSIATAFVALLVMSLTHSTAVFGNMTPVAYGYLVCWVFLNPLSEIRLFFALPFKAKNLLFTLLGINLFLEISQLNFLAFFSNLTGALMGYLFSLFIEKGPFVSSFSWWNKIQMRFFSFRARFKNKDRSQKHGSHKGTPSDHSGEKNKENKNIHESKIYDFSTGKPQLSDEDFMDAMLQRISLYGESILTKEEKQRMESISQKKKNKP
jgi:membrane associated rhomboid family serine protease